MTCAARKVMEASMAAIEKVVFLSPLSCSVFQKISN